LQEIDLPKRGSLLTLLSRPSPFASESGALAMGEFEPVAAVSPTSALSKIEPLAAAKVLVVGAGGLGCELLKDLAMSGISNVEVSVDECCGSSREDSRQATIILCILQLYHLRS
jgi:hypothetical protein